MDVSFSWAWFLGGLAIIIAGVVFMRFHEFVADNFGAGMADFQRYRLAAVIAIAAGFLAMLNLIPIVLGLFVSMLFRG